jgi:hypothetical protein
MDFIYVVVQDSSEWEDLVILLSETEAKEASIRNSQCRVEIFKRTEKGYVPSYAYYKDGILKQ